MTTLASPIMSGTEVIAVLRWLDGWMRRAGSLHLSLLSRHDAGNIRTAAHTLAVRLNSERAPTPVITAAIGRIHGEVAGGGIMQIQRNDLKTAIAYAKKWAPDAREAMV